MFFFFLNRENKLLFLGNEINKKNVHVTSVPPYETEHPGISLPMILLDFEFRIGTTELSVIMAIFL